MSIAKHIAESWDAPQYVINGYLDDLSDSDLLVRPSAGTNHIAWQLGHLIFADNYHVNAVAGDCMPKLPAGFAEKHTKDTAASDDPAAFLKKSEYIALMKEQHAGMRAALAGLSDEQLQQPSPESMRYFGPTVATIFSGLVMHWMMHAGQWVVVRRNLGRPPLF
jgi:hypothetical protein